MFSKKQNKLFEVESPKSASVSSTNAFVNAASKQSARTLSGNGSEKFSTTGNSFVDQFGKLGSYKAPRGYQEIASDTSELWAKDPFLTVCFIFFMRMITRVVQLFDGTKTTTPQRGAGLKHEGITRMIWLHINHKDVFWKNIPLFISIGSWKDIIQMLSYDLQYNGWKDRQLNWEEFGKLLLAGLENPNTANLVKKYLPQIKTNSKCKTLEAQADNMISKWLCNLLFGNKGEESGWTYKQYRKLKVSGNGHLWQQFISRGQHHLIDFNTVHGRALAQMVSSKYIANNKLEKQYEEWISNKPIAKFTGYVHELFTKLPQKKYQIDTLNSQFKGLVETAKKGTKQETSLIVVRDTSGSMSSSAPGTKQSCYDIGKALALFFSEMLPKGAFANSWIEFNSKAKMHQWKGSTPFEKWSNDHSSFVGETDFQSVIKLLCDVKAEGVPEDQFPTGILCISDSEFNPAALGKTNVETALHVLRNNGFSKEYCDKFQIILWNLQNFYYGKGSGEKFETYGNVPNVYYFSGFEPAIVAFLTGVQGQKSEPKNAEELFLAAMDQECMNLIQM